MFQTLKSTEGKISVHSSCGVTPASSQAPHGHSHNSRIGETIRRVKDRELTGRDTDSSIGKTKPTHTSKTGINSLLPVGRQVFNHLQESRAPPHVTLT